MLFSVSKGQQLVVGNDEGWCQWVVEGCPDVRVRLAVRGAGGAAYFQVIAIAAGALGKSDEARLTSEVLRRLPLASLERFVNRPAIAANVTRGLSDPAGPDLRPEREAPPLPPRPEQTRLDIETAWDRLKIDVPVGARDDSFYEAVLARFEEASRWSRSPAVEIARANGKPLTTVHRWIREAKRRAGQKHQRLPGL